MAPVVTIELVFLLLAVLQIQTSAVTPNGLLLFLCPVQISPSPSSTLRPLPNQSMVRRDDYTYTPGIGGHKFHTRAATWNEARRTCDEEGGNLAIINSIEESNVIMDIFAKSGRIIGATGGFAHAFIGFHDLYQEGDYVTVQGRSLAKSGFTLWGDGEPSKTFDGDEEDCGSVNRNGRFNDAPCTTKIAFICEMPMS